MKPENEPGRAIARNLYEMSSLETPILSVLIGEGGSGGALAMAVADEVWILKMQFILFFLQKAMRPFYERWQSGSPRSQSNETDFL